ncbi:MAG: TetR/AcrR family transcriptional regulator [Candidatus Limnocylindrales bacterium]
MSGPARGRPRDARIDGAILEAALRQLDEVGYQQMSMAAVAAEAGVGRPALYRRYGSKAELVTAAIQHMTSGPEPDLPSAVHEALRRLLGAASSAVASPGGLAVLGSLLAEQRRDPELLAAFGARVFEPRRAVIQRLVAEGAMAGEVAADADGEAVDGLLFGALLARAILGEPVDAAWVDRVVDQLWRGIAAPTMEGLAR